MARFEVTVGGATMTSVSGAAIRFPHRWTHGRVTVAAVFVGAHPLHLARSAGSCPI